MSEREILLGIINQFCPVQSDICEIVVFLYYIVSTFFPNQILELLIPEERVELSDLVLEVTAGVGGQEAMLFTAQVCWNFQDKGYICAVCSYTLLCFELHPAGFVWSPLQVFEMYQGFAQYHGWSFDILEHMTSDLG